VAAGEQKRVESIFVVDEFGVADAEGVDELEDVVGIVHGG